MGDALDTRTILVRSTWTTTHYIDVPMDHPPIDESDIDSVLEIEDITPVTADLTDWEVIDRGI